MKLLCETMGVNRSSFYYWEKRLGDSSPRTKNLIDNIQLFQECHMKYPSHGYRWLNAKIHLDTGPIMSDPFAHKCCKIAGITVALAADTTTAGASQTGVYAEVAGQSASPVGNPVSDQQTADNQTGKHFEEPKE